MTYCKLGDRAIIIHSAAGNEGKIVKVVFNLGYHTDMFKYQGRYICYLPASGQMWEVESEGFPLRSTIGPPSQSGPLPDVWLRPLPKVGEEEKESEVKKNPVAVVKTKAVHG